MSETIVWPHAGSRKPRTARRVFLDATAAAAVIDRVVHHAVVLKTDGDSYRLKAARRKGADSK